MLKNQKGNAVVIVVVILFIIVLGGITWWTIETSKSRSSTILKEQPKATDSSQRQ